MTRLFLLAATALMLLGCGPSAPPSSETVTQPAAESAADRQFAELAQRWLDGMLALSPISATQIGEHRHDAEIDDLSAMAQAKATSFTRETLAALDAIDVSQLSRTNQVDAALLRNRLRYDLWNDESLQPLKWNPQIYNDLAGGALYGLMAREFAPLPDRLKAATARMEKLPTLFAQMRENLDPARVPAVHAETVAKQNRGIISLIDELIAPHASALAGEEQARLQAAMASLKKAVEEHQQWIETQLVPNAKGDFRLGAKLYDEKLAFALASPLSRQEIRRRAEAELRSVRETMYGIARGVLQGRPNAPEAPEAPSPEQQQQVIEAALEIAYSERPKRQEVVDAAKAAVEQATRFTRERDLVTVPETPIKIILMPEFQRGVAVAYCDPPGPLEKHLDTFYAVSPIPDEWSDEQVDSFLREYNSRMIHLLSIHEATPGHYLQLAHANRYPSVLRAVLASGSFIEGWAVYSERVMTQAGYLDGDPLFHLVQLKFYLRAIANALLDQGVHVDGMTREQAIDLMVRQTFQQEREAAGKWVRAQLTSAQLPTYFVGVQEHLDLRAEVERREGAGFDLKRYHDRVLSYGSPPVRYVRQLMLDEPITP